MLFNRINKVKGYIRCKNFTQALPHLEKLLASMETKEVIEVDPNPEAEIPLLASIVLFELDPFGQPTRMLCEKYPSLDKEFMMRCVAQARALVERGAFKDALPFLRHALTCIKKDRQEGTHYIDTATSFKIQLFLGKTLQIVDPTDSEIFLLLINAAQSDQVDTSQRSDLLYLAASIEYTRARITGHISADLTPAQEACFQSIELQDVAFG
jgi:hypothetical protein